MDTVILKENGFVKSRCGKVKNEAVLMVTAWDVLYSQTVILYSVWLVFLL